MERTTPSRYRRISVRMWGDDKFRRLSPSQPCGQALWVWLLTGPLTGIIPGVIVSGPAGMAERLGWSTKAFREAFGEVFREGMAKVDWETGFVFLPRAVIYNPPASPNVVKSWAPAWDEIPECALKAEAWQTLKAFLEGIGEAFGKGFEKACPKPKANQEQEQEQEQEEKPSPILGSRVDPKSWFEEFWTVYPRRNGKREGKQEALQKFLAVVRSELIFKEMMQAVQNYARNCGDYAKDAHRWLAKDRWREWVNPDITPAQTDWVDDLPEW